jgi:hypothetical protein
VLTQSSVQVKCHPGISHVAIRFRAGEPEAGLALSFHQGATFILKYALFCRQLRRGEGGFAPVRDPWPGESAIQHVFGRPKGTVGPAVQAEAATEGRKRHTNLIEVNEAIGIAEASGV